MPGDRLDILLVHCEAGTSPVSMESNLAPLGLIELATFLRRCGFNASVIDTRHRKFSIEWYFDYIAEQKPRWVGIDVLVDTVFTAGRLAQLARQASPSSRVVLGGAHATVCADELLQEIEPDAIVLGEGEIACGELLSKSKLKDVRGIAYSEAGKVVRTPRTRLIDMDALPIPDLSVVQNHQDMGYGPSVHTGRGCPYRCTFCAAPILGPKVRYRSIDRVISDIQSVLFATKTRYLLISDDTFTFDRRRVMDFCKAIETIGGGKDLFWYAEGRIDRLAGDRELIRAMHHAGLRFLQLGVESGDERTLKAYNKGISLDQARWVFEALADEGILTHGGFIGGGPFESPKTVSKTENLIRELTELCRGFFLFRLAYLNPLPGTRIYEHPDEFGLRILDPTLLTSTGFDNAVTETDSMSREEILLANKRMSHEMIPFMKEVMDQQSEERHDEIRRIHGEIGSKHMAFGLLHDINVNEQLNAYVKMVIGMANRYDQFFTYADEHALDLIPARLPIFTLDENGRYYLPHTDTHFTQTESDVFNFSSGKLTGHDIAHILELSDDEMRKTLKGLCEKKAIIYRSF